MAKHDDKIIEFPSEAFSRVALGSGGAVADAALGHNAGLRLMREERLATDMLLEKSEVTIFTFDLAEDALYYSQVMPDGTPYKRRISRFTRLLEKVEQSDDDEGKKFAAAILAAKEEPKDAVLKFRAKLFTKQAHWYQLNYRSLLDKEGKVYAIIGHNRVAEDTAWLTMEMPRSMREATYTDDGEVMERMVNEKLKHLPEGEKGIMFLLHLSNLAELEKQTTSTQDIFLNTVVQNLKGDFRSGDLMAKLSNTEFVIFICGRTSIDIVEKRAQRIIDICGNITVAGSVALKSSVGIAATSSQAQRYDAMIKQADIALEDAKKRGENHFRLFENDKY